MKLSVIVPVYNEKGTVLALLEKVKAVAIDKEIIVIDNCSTDGTREMLQGLRDPAFRLLFQPENRGKGSSVRWGYAEARGEYVIVQDADLEYDPSDYPKLLEIAERDNKRVVYGTRLAKRPEKIDRTSLHLGRIGLTKVFNWLYDARLTDVATCYKLMPTRLAQSLQLNARGFDFDFEISAKLRRSRYDIVEVPISYHPRSAHEGKKLRIRDGWVALWALIKYRFTG